ncbi:MAG: TIGR00725 family protein [Candidatus Neomarinimicrobiota bacterium]
MQRPARIAVFGGREIPPQIYDDAREIGRLLAAEGWLVYCGGGDGVMEAICRGVSEGGGTTVGILKGRDLSEANPWVTIPVATAMGISRNALLAYNGDVALAIDGKYGTLSEIAYAAQLQIPVIGYHTWDLPMVLPATTPAEVIQKIRENL